VCDGDRRGVDSKNDAVTEELTDEDRRNLHDTCVAYAVGVDDRDYELLSDLFTETAEFDLPAGSRVGRAAIIEAIKDVETYESTFHLLGQSWFWVDEDDDTINGDTYCIAHHFAADGSERIMYIRYADEFVFEDRWRLSSRELLITKTVDKPAVAPTPNPN
jgi:hypothetical protein